MYAHSTLHHLMCICYICDIYMRAGWNCGKVNNTHIICILMRSADKKVAHTMINGDFN